MKAQNEKQNLLSGILIVISIISLLLGIYNFYDNKINGYESQSLYDAYTNATSKGYHGSMTDWLTSMNSKFSYVSAIENGFVGTKEDWDRQIDKLVKEIVKNSLLTSSEISNIKVVGNDLIFTLSDGSTLKVGAVSTSDLK